MGLGFPQRYAMEQISAPSVVLGRTAQGSANTRVRTRWYIEIRTGAARRQQILQLFNKAEQRAAQGGAFRRVGECRHDEPRTGAARCQQKAERQAVQGSARTRVGPCRHTRQRIFSEATHPGFGYSLPASDMYEWLAVTWCSARHCSATSFSFAELHEGSSFHAKGTRKYTRSPQPTVALQLARVALQIMLPDEFVFFIRSICAVGLQPLVQCRARQSSGRWTPA